MTASVVGYFEDEFCMAHDYYSDRVPLCDEQVCAACHGTGVLNAPKFGDKAKWAPLIAEGQVTLTAHAYFGVRGMPPKGGNPNLSIEGFSDALVYMVNNSGGNWKSPDAQTIAAINKEVEARKTGANKKQ